MLGANASMHIEMIINPINCRDTVSLFGEKINQNDKTETDHFENIQSTNW